jgi:polyhydroxyalkanoate synthesis regulator phasin
MAKVRRRIQRPARSTATTDARRQARLQKKHEQLAKEQAALSRWTSKLKRAFHTVEKQQQRIARLEKQLSQLEQG